MSSGWKVFNRSTYLPFKARVSDRKCSMKTIPWMLTSTSSLTSILRPQSRNMTSSTSGCLQSVPEYHHILRGYHVVPGQLNSSSLSGWGHQVEWNQAQTWTPQTRKVGYEGNTKVMRYLTHLARLKRVIYHWYPLSKWMKTSGVCWYYAWSMDGSTTRYNTYQQLNVSSLT